MAGENSKILLGLPNLPDNNLDPKLWNELLTVYRAIQNLLAGVSEFGGIDAPDTVEINSMDPTKYLLGNNIGRWYPTCDEAIARGQVVRATNVSGANRCARADASSGLLYSPAIGVANTAGVAGQKIEVLVAGITTAIGGMTPGTLYYLSTTSGAIQNLRPVGAGQAVQPIGWALTTTQMLIAPSSYVQVL